jgi:uncharacterized protein (TIGR03435 family)
VTLSSGVSIAQGMVDALDKQVGLKIEPRSVTLRTIRVERVNRTPTPNPAAVAAAFPAGPAPEFEVAEVKASAGGQMRRQILPNGQFTAAAIPLRDLIALGWQVTEASSIIGPKEIENSRYDVIARFSSRPLDPSEVDPDAISAMMRRLLEDRFHLKAHFEERPMEAPTLVASSNPRLIRTKDPDSRTRCVRGNPSTSGANSMPAFQVKCQNITLTEFAQRLQREDSALFKYPVLDATGLDGRFDITLTFVPSVLLQALLTARSAAAARGGDTLAAGAADPVGAMTISEALVPLGLKIETRRRPVQVLVVDSVDEKPTDN